MIRALQNIDTNRFNRACAAIALAFLILTQAARCARDMRMTVAPGQDFAQYYMGGLIAMNGEWDVLYPIAHPGALNNAGFSGSSEVHERYRQLANEHGIGDFSMRFFQPPPAALLFVPLALLPYRASLLLWTALLILTTWGVAMEAGQMHAIALGRRTKWIGALMLLICFSLQ